LPITSWLAKTDVKSWLKWNFPANLGRRGGLEDGSSATAHARPLPPSRSAAAGRYGAGSKCTSLAPSRAARNLTSARLVDS
jgi:hypothetical protein